VRGEDDAPKRAAGGGSEKAEGGSQARRRSEDELRVWPPRSWRAVGADLIASGAGRRRRDEGTPRTRRRATPSSRNGPVNASCRVLGPTGLSALQGTDQRADAGFGAYNFFPMMELMTSTLPLPDQPVFLKFKKT